MITVTDDAVEHIKELLAEEDRATKGLRLFTTKGGCSGMEYNMEIDGQHDGDHVVEAGDVKVFLSQDSEPYLKGSVIDYNSGLTNTGFRIQNPNAKQTCGCGTSFEA
ncbi:MAG: iron-sulfur cluster assembly accessory protein [Verrucomicrobiota bacterium]